MVISPPGLWTLRPLPAPTNAGRTDMAYRVLLTDTYPGWLFQVKQGATTMWERWDGYTPEKGFQDPGMNSLNHYAFGSVSEWLYRTVAGIETDGPGSAHYHLPPARRRTDPCFGGSQQVSPRPD